MDLELKRIEKEKERIAMEYNKKLRELYIGEITKIFKWFRFHFPKRELKWTQSMGVEFWSIDGKIFDFETTRVSYVSSIGKTRYLEDVPWTRKMKVLRPLVQFMDSILNVDHGEVYIGDITEDDIDYMGDKNNW